MTVADGRLERDPWRHAGWIWALLFVNGLTFSAVPTLLPIPEPVVQIVAQAALGLAFVSVLIMNRQKLVRPNLCLGLFTLLLLCSLITSVRLNTGTGSLARELRFATFLAVLWLLTPLWGRRDLQLARWHVRCLAVACATVVVGLILGPGAALQGGRLSGRIWPIAATQVGHYAAVLSGMLIVAWIGGLLTTRPALVVAGAGFVIVLLTQTRTAMIGLVVGVAAAMLSLVVQYPRARRGLVVLLVAGMLAALPLAGVASDWFERGQSSEQLAGLTGRTQVWDRVLQQQRSGLERWLGAGLSNKSFEGLPIDNSWLAVYEDQGLVGGFIVAAILLTLLVTCLIRPRGPASALALFLVCYCAIASYTETGLGDASPYILDLVVAASLLMGPAVASVSAARPRASMRGTGRSPG
jgi:O-antigen ligase